jgi:hypothetical protein
MQLLEVETFGPAGATLEILGMWTGPSQKSINIVLSRAHLKEAC